MDWSGVFPTITTPFRPDLSVDHDALAAHIRWLIDSGCGGGIVALGSLGESQTLTMEEKLEILATCDWASGSRSSPDGRQGVVLETSLTGVAINFIIQSTL